jgi:hypothetical protein
MALSKTYRRHLAAIEADAVTKSNIIGLRKIFNMQTRRDLRLSVSRTAPRITEAEVRLLADAIAINQPRVTGELHDSGVKLLQNPRYRRRWTKAEAAIIADLDHFRLAGFEDHRMGQHTPVYRAFSKDGRSFAFWNIPWQSGGDGPHAI